MSLSWTKGSRCLWALVVQLFFICSLPAADAKTPRLADQFDEQKAMAHVRQQVEFGPRPAGSEALAKTRGYLAAELRQAGWQVAEQSFQQQTLRGPIQFINLRATRPAKLSLVGDRRPTLILASHYDTKWLPKIQFVGANDGASSTAVLLEVARVLGQSGFEPKEARVELVFFDGEEAAAEYSETDGLHGSRYYVREIKRAKRIKNIAALILLDMVGDRDLQVAIPDGDPPLIQRVFRAAKTLGCREKFQLLNQPMLDDHQPFLQEKIPAVDLIDFEYGPAHGWWHTAADTLDKVSPQSLKIVGQTVLQILSQW